MYLLVLRTRGFMIPDERESGAIDWSKSNKKHVEWGPGKRESSCCVGFLHFTKQTLCDRDRDRPHRCRTTWGDVWRIRTHGQA